MDVILNIDLEMFRFSLIGDGYLLDEVLEMSHERLIDILRNRINDHIAAEYYRGKRLGLFINEDDRNFK